MSRESWGVVRELWHKATVFCLTITSSLTHEAITEEEYKKRYDSCFGSIVNNVPICEFLNQTEKGNFCNSCGCGTNRLARLGEGSRDKLRYPALKCPEGKF